MKKIAYIEIDTHAEIAQSFMDISKGMTRFSVDYYLSQKIKNHVQIADESVFLSDASMILDQLKNKSYDLIIIGTVHRYFNTFLEITKKYNTSIIVHNLNFSQASNAVLLKNILKEDVVYRLKLLAKEGLLNTSKVYKNAKNLLVLDEEMSSLTYPYLPLFYTQNCTQNQDEVLRIVIPGGVSQKRRDYFRVFEKIKAIDKEFYDNKSASSIVEFVFLGKASGEELNRLVDLEKTLNYISIQYFKERVSTLDFNSWMGKADVLWSPIQEENLFFSQKEIYGKTKMTGNIGDAIKYGKMAVFPANYQSQQGFIYSEENDVLSQFLNLKNNPFNFELNFNKKAVQERFEQLLSNLVSN